MIDPLLVIIALFFGIILIGVAITVSRRLPLRTVDGVKQSIVKPYNLLFIPDEGKTVEIWGQMQNADGSFFLYAYDERGHPLEDPIECLKEEVVIRGGNPADAIAPVGGAATYIKLNADIMDSKEGKKQYEGKWDEVIAKTIDLRGEKDRWKRMFLNLEENFDNRLKDEKDKIWMMQMSGGKATQQTGKKGE